ncbi:MAG: ribonuclease III [Bacteroidota bacterium]|nr:ribonuclease III [Bacteroidota bacterium]
MAIKVFLSQFNFKKTKGDKEFKNWIKTTTGYSPKNLVLYQQAFLHSSAAAKRHNTPISNERLEFLGDAVLGAIIAEHLFKIYPYKDEGFLTQLRSKIVNGQNLKELSLKFGFNNQLKANLTKDEKIKSSAFGDAFEAFIGAVYLDLGYDKTKKFVASKIIKFHVDITELVNTDSDFKSQLQIYCQKNKLNLEYKLISEEKQGANKIYAIQVFINDKPYIKFENFSKRVAEQKAAQLTLEELQKEIG